MNVTVTGTLGFDYIMDFAGRFADRIMPEKIHVLSLSFLVEHLNKQFGGTAGNIAYTLKLLGIDPFIIAPAGNDFGPYKAFLESNHIETKYIAVHKNVSTSAYFVMTDKADNQIGAFFVGATKYAKDLSICQDIALRGKERPSKKFAVLTATDPAAMRKYVKECRRFNLSYLYDPAFQIATFTASELREGIEGAQILVGNDYEITLIEQKLGISHEELILIVPILITTLGGKGSIIETRHDAIHVKPAKPKNDTDPTGAGDAYRAGFVAGYLKVVNSRAGPEFTGDELLICGQMGSVAAVYTVETYGTQTHTFTKKEFAQRYADNYGTLPPI